MSFPERFTIRNLWVGTHYFPFTSGGFVLLLFWRRRRRASCCLLLNSRQLDAADGHSLVPPVCLRKFANQGVSGLWMLVLNYRASRPSGVRAFYPCRNTHLSSVTAPPCGRVLKPRNSKVLVNKGQSLLHFGTPRSSLLTRGSQKSDIRCQTQLWTFILLQKKDTPWHT